MNTERVIRIIAGAFILLSVFASQLSQGAALTQPSWLWLTLFVGLNLLQSGFTQWCLMEQILLKLGVKPGTACASC